MGLFSRKNKKEPVVEERKVHLGGLLFNSTSSYHQTMAMKLSAVYCATNQIANSVAMLPIDIVKTEQGDMRPIQHPLWQVLNLSPEPKFSHFNIFKMALESVMLQGNAYFFIERDERLNVKALRYLNADFVQPLVQEDGTVKYLVAGMNTAVDASNMIHLYMHLDENFNGISIIRYAYLSLENASDAENTAGKFFRGGAGLNGVLKASATLTNEQKKQIRSSWLEAFSATGSGVAVIPQGVDYQPISVNPKDAQLLEAMEWFGVNEIARFWNISPIRLFQLDEVSYSSMEATNLAYLQDTIAPYCAMIEEEFNRKLFKPSEVGKIGVSFNFNRAMRTNRKDTAEYYRTMLLNGIMSLNEVRGELGLEKVSGKEGDAHLIQLSYASLEDVASGKYIKQSAKAPTEQGIDGKAKGTE